MRRFFLLMLTVAVGVSCGNDTVTSPTTDTADTRTDRTFTGTIGPGETKFYSFTVRASGVTEVTLLSLRPATTPVPALTAAMALSIGTPVGTGCRASTTLTVQPALLPQLTASTSPTIYCASVDDVGYLSAPAAFTIRIHHP